MLILREKRLLIDIITVDCYTDGARKAANNILLGSRDFSK